MSLELNEEIHIKSESIEEHDFMSDDVDFAKVAFEVQDIEFESNGTSGDSATLNCNETSSMHTTDVDPVKIGGEVAKTSMLTQYNSDHPLHCEFCKRRFTVKQSFIYHLKTLHKVDCSIACFVCNKTFVTQKSLSIHQAYHADIQHPLYSRVKKYPFTYTCKICGIKQNSKFEVVQHIKSVHLGLKGYKCKVCSTYFTEKTGLFRHSIFQHSEVEPFACEICSYKSSRTGILKKHMITTHKLDEVSVDSLLPSDDDCKSSLFCKVCDIELLSGDELYQHIRAVHVSLDQLKCPVCQEEFTSVANLIDHLRTHDVPDQPFSCGMCEERFSTENDRNTHLVNFHNKSPDGSSSISTYECDKCKKVFTCTEQLKKHNIELHHSNSFSCFKCNKCGMFGSFDNLEKHVAANHAKESSVTFSFCKANFSSLESLKIHLANMHENTFENPEQNISTEEPISSDSNITSVECEEIDIKSETIEKHDFNKNYAFEEQDSAFESNKTSGHSSTLSDTVTDIKTEINPLEIGGWVTKNSLFNKISVDSYFSCEICHKEFKSKVDFIKHLRYVHDIKNVDPCIICPTKCCLCKKTFATQSSLRVHLLSHAEILHPFLISEKNYDSTRVCKICGTTKKTNFKEHIKSVHLGIKEHKCKVCGSCFDSKTKLISHFIVKHCEYEALSCVLCSFKTNFKSNLRQHILYMHDIDKNSVASLLPAHRINDSLLKCKVCVVEFQVRENFNQHVSDVHEGLDQIKCPVCHKDFTCIVTLIGHLHAHGGTKQEQDNELESDETSGDCTTLSVNKTDIKIEMDPVEIGGEVTTNSLLNKITVDNYFTCEICHKQFNTQVKFSEHLRCVHTNKNIDPNTTCFTKCFVCKKNFLTQSRYRVHLLSHSEILHQLFSSGDSTSVCKVCGIKKKKSLANHIKSVHLGLKEYKCKVCSTYFTQRTGLFRHFIIKHSEFEPLYCVHCSFKTFFKKNMRTHILKVHKVNKNLVHSLLPARSILCKTSLHCKVCDIQFQSHEKFHQHISDVHEERDIIKCPVCQKNFTCIVKLFNHLQESCRRNEPVSCGICKKWFLTEKNRSTHMVNFHNKSPDGSSGSSSYECDKCQKVFTCSDQLKKHNLEIHNSNLLSCFKCDKCDMFGSFDNLEKHVAANHANEKSVAFSVCKETFRSVQSLKIHLATLHKNTFETSSQNVSTKMPISSYSRNIKAVKCEICKQEFRYPSSLKNHINKIHKINQKQTSLQQNRRERQKVSQREHRTAEYLKNRLGSSPVKPQLQQAMEGRKVRPDSNSTTSSRAEILSSKVKPCCVLLDRGEVTRYLARLDKREEGAVGSSPIEDLPPPLATPPVRVYPSHPCGRVRVTSDRLLSAATSNVGLVCNNMGPRAIVEPEQLCVVNSGDGEGSSNNCIKSANPPSKQLGNFEEMYIKSEPIFFSESDFGDPLSS